MLHRLCSFETYIGNIFVWFSNKNQVSKRNVSNILYIGNPVFWIPIIFRYMFPNWRYVSNTQIMFPILFGFLQYQNYVFNIRCMFPKYIFVSKVKSKVNFSNWCFQYTWSAMETLFIPNSRRSIYAKRYESTPDTTKHKLKIPKLTF